MSAAMVSGIGLWSSNLVDPTVRDLAMILPLSSQIMCLLFIIPFAAFVNIGPLKSQYCWKNEVKPSGLDEKPNSRSWRREKLIIGGLIEPGCLSLCRTNSNRIETLMIVILRNDWRSFKRTWRWLSFRPFGAIPRIKQVLYDGKARRGSLDCYYTKVTGEFQSPFNLFSTTRNMKRICGLRKSPYSIAGPIRAFSTLKQTLRLIVVWIPRNYPSRHGTGLHCEMVNPVSNSTELLAKIASADSALYLRMKPMKNHVWWQKLFSPKKNVATIGVIT